MWGKSTIIIAHRLSTIKNADHIFVIEKGLVVEEGEHHELISRKNIYHNLVNSEEECGLIKS
ncbi:hypothetical protein DLJ74_15795 [Gracilibacillus dipsosauri]|uniref:ABC transporter ATP-binding protein n=1 Tax=Gracilibacillus dipsosauri TaxID=178340 RepID=A0A317KVS8_9BACI|nr:hypothetical protein DLJ74_15795 [Gracilibacillus dipsosauri]